MTANSLLPAPFKPISTKISRITVNLREMSVEELAGKMGVSNATIYGRVKSRGLHYPGKNNFTDIESQIIMMDIEDISTLAIAYLRKEEKNFLILESKMNF